MRLSPHHPRRRGFSLIEAAIVLGIIGLIIGGIWVAAAAVSNRNRINDAIALITVAHEEGLQLKKTVIDVYTDLVPILDLRTLPGHYSAHGNTYLNNGRQWFAVGLTLNAGSVSLGGAFVLDARSFLDPASNTKPDLCLELSKKLLSVNLGGASGDALIIWYTASLSPIATLYHGDPKPDPATLSTTCQTAARIGFKWYL